MSDQSQNENPKIHRHIPVLLNEVMDMFALGNPEPRHLLDGTFGRGGHTRELLNKYPGLTVTGIDRDLTAIAHAEAHFAAEIAAGRLKMYHGSFADFVESPQYAENTYDGVLLDLGVSSPQIDDPERGFSFYHDGPLDMRMNHKQKTTAATIINEWDEDDLVDVFKNYGEVHKPYRVIRAIVHDRKTKPFTSTRELASMIERVEGWRNKGKHPATLYFMGLRLVVNQELEHLTSSLPLLIRSLVPGGIIAVITFHSLEDRIVKNIFKDHGSLGSRINKKVIVPTEAEEKENSRSRSAKLRAFSRSHHEEDAQRD